MPVFSTPSLEVLCEGCEHFFSSSGYSRHISTTTNLACRSIYNEANDYLPGVNEPDEHHCDHQPSIGPQEFQGDFFGQDYSEYDLGIDPGANPQDQEHHTSDIQNNDHIEYNPDAPDDWEPAIDERYRGPFPEEEHPLSEPDSQQDQARRAENENILHQTPFRKLFPRSKGNPGAPMTLDKGENTYEKYRIVFEKSSAGNPYAPFSSRLDWEFSRWVKLRGPGSTAVDELLALDNVSLCHLYAGPQIYLSNLWLSL